MRSPRLTLVVVAAIVALLALSISDAAPRFDPPPAQSMSCGHVAPEPGAMFGRPFVAGCEIGGSLAGGGAAISGAATGSIHGTVTEEGTGTPLENVCVFLTDEPGSDPFARTDVSGTYLITGLTQQPHNIFFADCGGAGFHRPEWHDNKATYDTADPVTPAPDATVDAQLTVGGGAISGAVTESPGGMPLENMCVYVWDPSWRFVGAAQTDASGLYSAEGLDPGQYILFFSPCAVPDEHISEYYENHGSIVDAQTVTVAPNVKTPGIDAALALGGSIQGSLVSGGPLEGDCVTAIDSQDMTAGLGYTDAAGHYVIDGLASGDYTVIFEDCTSPRYHISEWYNNSDTQDGADVVHVGGAGSVAQLATASLAVGGSISGNVLGPGGAPVTNMCAEGVTADSFVGFAVSQPGGNYELGGLPPDDYLVLFHDCRDAPTFPIQWTGGTAAPDPSNSLHVTREMKTSAPDATFSSVGLINGTVTSATGGVPLWQACMFAVDGDGSLMAVAGMDGLGKYSTALRAGNYKVFFFLCEGEEIYNPEWYNNELYFDEADNVSVGGAGTKRSNINAALDAAVLGDSGCDGQVNSIDAALVLQESAGYRVIVCVANADVNRDGAITAVDAALILQYVAGLIPSLAPG